MFLLQKLTSKTPFEELRMQLRTNILPKCIQDACVTTFVFFIVPTVYWFEMFLVLPTFYEAGSWWYKFHFVTGTFILFNISGNLVATILCDTSTKGKVLPSTLGPNWHFCTVCESVAPPRSWHCNVCKTCILKRDHHCIFTSCCIGHYNLRYFLMFVFYLFIATIYATFYNFYFIRNYVDFSNIYTLIRLVFPLAMVFVELSQGQFYIFLCLIIIIGGIFTGVLLYYHTKLMFHGQVTYERNHNVTMYDLGRKENIRNVLGCKWYLVWMSPFISSELPNDGINWPVQDTSKNK